MRTNELRPYLLGQLSKEPGAIGFVPHVPKCSLRRTEGSLVQEFRVQIIRKSGWWLVSPQLQVTWRPICRLYNKILQRKDPLRYSLLGFAIRNEFVGRGEYRVSDQAELDPV